jgi:hypothetical protein
MRSFLFISLFGLVLLGGQESVLNNFAYARHTADHCCMCGSCYSYCWCSGQANCKCYANDWKNILTLASADDLRIDIRQGTQMQSLKDERPEFVGSVMTFVRASRIGGNSTMKLADHIGDYMRFKCMSLES